MSNAPPSKSAPSGPPHATGPDAEPPGVAVVDPAATFPPPEPWVHPEMLAGLFDDTDGRIPPPGDEIPRRWDEAQGAWVAVDGPEIPNSYEMFGADPPQAPPPRFDFPAWATDTPPAPPPEAEELPDPFPEEPFESLSSRAGWAVAFGGLLLVLTGGWLLSCSPRHG